LATNAEAIASALQRAGIEYAFGLPGGEVVYLIDACRRAGVRFYLTGHEASAAFMAEVTGQLTGRPGVCVSTLGPGAMNLLLGLANARLDRGPVLALTAQISTEIERHFPHQRLPLEAIFSQVCKASVSVTGAGTADLAAWCLATAAAPPPGPVHLAIPSNLAGQTEGPGSHRALSAAGASASPAHADSTLREIADLMRAAQRPLLMVGVGCLPTDAPALRRFVDAADVPFVVTPKAKGLLREDVPGFLGVISGMAIDRTMLETLDHADLLVGIGFDPVECDKPWYIGRRIVNLNRYRTAEGDYAPIECLGEIAPMVERLQARMTPRRWPPDLLAARRAAADPAPLPASDGLSPLAAVRALRDVIPSDAVMTCDVGSHKYFVGQFWRAFHPQTFFMSNGLSAMGYGIPAAIAAKIHFGERPVVAVVGDGGMFMMLHNLIFLQQYRLPLVIVCFVDGSLSLIRVAQERRGVQAYGVDFPAPDFSSIATAYGVQGMRVSTLDELKRTVADALRARLPAVVHVPVDMAEYQAYC
jgi:acetolactate synthase-1/2/3 large subunit